MAAARSRTGGALAFGAGGFFLVYFGQVDLGVVQPQIQVDLRLSHDQALWIVNSFMLGLAVLVPHGGRLADILGPRTAILAGLGTIAVGAAGAAVAGSFGILVASLGVQGAGAGIAIAATVAIVVAAYPPEHRGMAVGRYAGLGVLALPIAPVVAGALIQVGEWRLTFWLYLVLTLAVIAVGLARVPPEPRSRGQTVDVPGGLLAFAGLALVLTGGIEAAAWGWSSAATWAVMGVGVAMVAAFVAIELRTEEPLVDLRLLRSRRMAGAAGALFLTQLGVSGVAIFIPIYLLTIVRLDPLLTGLAMLPAMVFPPALSPLAGNLVDRHGSRGLAIGGAALAAAGCAWLAGFAPDQEYGMLVPGLVLFGLGVPLAYAAIITAGASATPASERGAGAGLVNTARWVGATVGTVAFGATLNAVRTSDLDATLAGRTLSGVEWDRIDRLVLVDEEATGTVMTGLGARVVDAVTDAFAAGYGAGLWLCAAAFVVVVIVAATTLGPRDRGA